MHPKNAKHFIEVLPWNQDTLPFYKAVTHSGRLPKWRRLPIDEEHFIQSEQAKKKSVEESNKSRGLGKDFFLIIY